MFDGFLDHTQTGHGVSSLYGNVYFLQKKDPKNPRGYSQGSLVILSTLPFCSFFKSILDVIAAETFEKDGIACSEQFLQVRMTKITFLNLL